MSRSKFKTLKSPQISRFCRLIAANGNFVLSYISFISIEYPNEIEGKVLPLYSKTGFKLVFDEYIASIREDYTVYKQLPLIY